MRNIVKPNHVLLAALGLSALLIGGGWLAWAEHHLTKPAPKMVYVASGYGGFVPAPAKKDRPSGLLHPVARPQMVKPADSVQPLREAYNAGHYPQVEAAALRLVSQAKTSRSRSVLEQGAEAGSLLAYAAARRHDLKLAQARFAAAQVEAARLPDKGKQADLPGQVSPTLEEDAAFQHAVCTNALGNPGAAEKEYVAWMRRYPESPLRNAVVLRLEKLHGGNLTPAEETVQRQASLTAQVRQEGREREASLCGPECLAELLRRRGDAVSVHTLASQMHTSSRGTTLEALAGAARQRGFSVQGLALTPRGLSEQTLPVIALVAPGHYVLVDQVTAAGVTLWDPDARGIGQGAARTVPAAIWRQQWRGVTLALAPVRTARV